MNPEAWDAIVVGGRPAGLSAALVLGRCRRRVLVCDDGRPRNERAHELHGYLTRDGITPACCHELARNNLAVYRNVTLLALRVAEVEQFYGRSVHHCPYCDGWEAQDEPIAIYGRRTRGFEMARALTAWGSDLVLCSDGASGLDARQKRHLARNGIRLIDNRIERLRGREGQLESIDFATGRRLPRRRLFFDLPAHARSGLARQLGCAMRRDGSVRCTGYEATDVPGVFIAGNIVGDVQVVIFAAAEGAKAAFGINLALTREDFERNATGRSVVEHPSA